MRNEDTSAGTRCSHREKRSMSSDYVPLNQSAGMRTELVTKLELRRKRVSGILRKEVGAKQRGERAPTKSSSSRDPGPPITKSGSS